MVNVTRECADTLGHYYRFYEDGKVVHIFYGIIPGDKEVACSINTLDVEHATRLCAQKQAQRIMFELKPGQFDDLLNYVVKDFLRI